MIMKQLTLVLGGGATKGYAHIGVLKVLEREGIKPNLIVGTSMGAIIGAMYASGKDSNYLIDLSKQLSKRKLMDFNLINAFFNSSILSGKKLRKLLISQLGNISHSDLNIPFVSIATDILNGKLEVLKEGNVVKNILASSAIPGIFPMIKQGDKTLCDGGVLNNVPDDIARKLSKNNVILSIDVIADYKKQVENSKLKIMGITINALTLMQTQITKFQGNCSDIRINISQPDVYQMSFDTESIKKSIEYGESAMKRNISKLKKMLQD